MSRFAHVEPCPRCGWKTKGFHICVDTTKPCRGEGLIRPPKVSKDSYKSNPFESLTDEQWMRMGLPENASRLGVHQDKNRRRDEEVIRLYSRGDLGMRSVADQVGISYHTVMGILDRADKAGVIAKRTRGATVAKGG